MSLSGVLTSDLFDDTPYSLPPTLYLQQSVVRYFYLPGEGPPIHSVLVIHHHRSAHDASTNLIVLANVMAPELPIHRSTYFAGGNIGPAHLTNLLRIYGLKRWRGEIFWLKHWGFSCFSSGGDSFAYCSVGSTFRETNFLVEGYLLFVFLFFWFLLVDCCMVHCPSFASFA